MSHYINFSISPELLPQRLSPSPLASFIMDGKCCLTYIGELEKNEMIKSIRKRQVFYLAEFWNVFFVFFFWESITSYVACYVVYSCRKTFRQSFTDVFKKSVLKHFATFTGKYRRCSLILIKLQELKLLFSSKKTLPHWCFLMNIARFLKTGFLGNTCSLYFSEILCDDRY